MKTAARCAFQTLEARRMMTVAALTTSTTPYAGGTMLKIGGTAGNDTITLGYDGTNCTLATAAGFTRTVAGPFTAIKVNAGNGNDRVTVDAAVTVPNFLYGEAGNDTLTGGSGDDAIYGGAGTNWLYGMAGRDTLVALGNTALDGLTGGAGEDFFWLDAKTTERVFDADAYETAHSLNRVAAFQTDKFITGTTMTQAVAVSPASQRFRDPDLTSSAYVYKRFDNRPLFDAAGPTADDIRQGQVGDCYFLCTLAGVAKTSPDTIRNEISDLGDGTYAVRFKSAAGATQYYRVDNDLAVYNAASTSPAYAALGRGGSMWVAIEEKAWAFARRSQGTYASIGSGWMTEAFTAVGATNSQAQWRDDSANADAYLNWIQQRLTAGDTVTVGVFSSNDALNLIGGHAYTVVRIDTLGDGTRQLVLRNPWGVDGYRTADGNNDGYVTLTTAGAFAGLDAAVSAHAV